MVCQDGEDEEIGGGGSEPPTSSGSVESCLRVVAQPIRPLFSLYNPSFPPFPAHIALLAPQVLFDYLRPMMIIHLEKGGWGGVIKIF